MFQLSELYDCIDYGISVYGDEILACEEECLFVNGLPQDEDMFGLCEILMDENKYQKPQTVTEAVSPYYNLREQITQLLM